MHLGLAEKASFNSGRKEYNIVIEAVINNTNEPVTARMVESQ